MATVNDNLVHSTLSQHRSAVVVGLGATGYSVVRYLRARGLSVSVVDSRQTPPLAQTLSNNYPDVACYFGELDTQVITQSSLLVVSPGIALNNPVIREAKYSGAQIVGDVELFLQENTQPVIAITGSNGKSTVTTLVGEMCRESGKKAWVAGNIGLPVLDALTDQIDYNVAVLELSSFQLETTSKVPAQAAAILNISADHMDRYDSMGDYVLAKARILRGAQCAVLPRHDEQLKQITTTNKVIDFDLDEPDSDNSFGIKRQSNQRWLVKGDERLMKLRDVPLTGLHNVKNVLSAFALLECFSLPLDSLVQAVKGFQGLPHRMQTIAVHNQVTWVNDSKATNIGATNTALKNLEQDVIWIAGGQGKGADFTELRDAVSSNIKQLILFGEDAHQIANALSDLLAIEHVQDMQSAVAFAAQQAQPDDIVLLSPACASLDMYVSFEHRGQDFADHVKALAMRGRA